MKTCSYCGRENADDAATCVECGVDFKPSEAPVPSDALDPALSPVIVAKFAHPADAGVLTSRLAAAGIDVCVPEEYSPQLFWNVLPSPMEQVTVRVAAKDYEAAKAIADEVLQLKSVTGELAKPTTDTAHARRCFRCSVSIPVNANICPNCGSDQTQRV